MEARGRVMPGPDGRPARMMGLIMDTTAMRAWRESQERQLREQRALATELQRGMLPRGPLAAPGLSIVARYQAATSGIEIGGDFYDVVNCANGQVALVIGDVQGHNLLAASLMGRLRTTVHAYAREGHSPQQVMAMTNRWLTGLNTDPDLALFATCCLVVVDPATGRLRISRAGHPPPVLASRGAALLILDCDPGIPLGIDPDAEYSATELSIAPGTLLVLTTDGLLETDSDDEYNLGRVLDVLARRSSDDLDELADKLLSSARLPGRHDDDVALLIARTH
jgi:serine phosphatase RsbU (regulator of sigma subunit)